MAWSSVPDLTSPGRPARLAVLVTLLLALVQILRGAGRLAERLGDTDDALRLHIVRGLTHGRGWFDTHIAEMQPPAGLDMHWSRLVDGGLAALYSVFALVLEPETAELAMRLIWPLLMIYPLVLSALLIARRLGGSPSVLAAAIFIACPAVLGQFAVGRIDHHNVQMALTMLMLAGAVYPQTRWGPWLAGLSTGLLLAVGVEALIFATLAGAVFALLFTKDAGFAPAARRYGMALAASALLAFFVQTPPRLWGIASCDMLSFNLLGGLVAASLGLIAASSVRGTLTVRFLAICAAGVFALAVYVALDPACLKGPYAGMDARLYPYWLDHVVEVRIWPALLQSHAALAVAFAVPIIMALGALVAMPRTIWKDPAWLTVIALFAAASLSGFFMVRILGYAGAFAALVLAGAFPALLPRRVAGVLVSAIAVAFVLSPTLIGGGTAALVSQLAPASKAREEKSAACRKNASYKDVALLPPGLVLADIDYGPDLIAHTGMSALAAPYHRMSEGISTAHEIWAAPASEAGAMLKARGVLYVMLCPGRGKLPMSFAEISLRSALERNTPPGFLEPVEAGDVFRIWRVR